MAKKEKKRAKKYNANKNSIKKSEYSESCSCLMYIQSMGADGKILIYNGLNIEFVDLPIKGKKAFKEILLSPHKWTLYCGCACRDQLGREYTKFGHQIANNNFVWFDPQIQGWLSEFMQEQINEVNVDHVLTAFYIAFPKQINLQKEKIVKLLEWRGVWNPDNLRTRYEMNCIYDEVKKETDKIKLSDFLGGDNLTASILEKNGLKNILDLFCFNAEYSSIKGIAKTREKKIVDSIQQYRKENENFEILTLDLYRKEQAKQFLLEDWEYNDKFYNQYLELTKKSGKKYQF